MRSNVRLVAPVSCPTIRTLRPRPHLPMGMRPSLAVMPIRSSKRLSEGPRGSSRQDVTRWAVEYGFCPLRANHCTGIITRNTIETVSAGESAV